MLKSDLVVLRLVDFRDATLIFAWESDKEIISYTERDAPLTIDLIESIIKEQRSVFDSGQVRYIICNNLSNVPLGMVDLYNIDFDQESAEVGIAIIDKVNRQKGFAGEALKLIHEYAESVLGIHCLTAFVEMDNVASNTLFKKSGYKMVDSAVSDKKMNSFKIEF